MSTQRWMFLLGFLFCVALMATALYFEYVMELEPCPLCAFQRLFVIGLGVIMLIGAIHDPGRVGRRVYGGLTLLVAILGVGVAGRHVWLQNLPPDEVPQCGPGIGYLFDTFPVIDALRVIFRGSGECAEVQWSFLGLTIPGWTLIVFCGLVLSALYLIFSQPDARQAEA